MRVDLFYNSCCLSKPPNNCRKANIPKQLNFCYTERRDEGPSFANRTDLVGLPGRKRGMPYDSENCRVKRFGSHLSIAI